MTQITLRNLDAEEWIPPLLALQGMNETGAAHCFRTLLQQKVSFKNFWNTEHVNATTKLFYAYYSFRGNDFLTILTRVLKNALHHRVSPTTYLNSQGVESAEPPSQPFFESVSSLLKSPFEGLFQDAFQKPDSDSDSELYASDAAARAAFSRADLKSIYHALVTFENILNGDRGVPMHYVVMRFADLFENPPFDTIITPKVLEAFLSLCVNKGLGNVLPPIKVCEFLFSHFGPRVIDRSPAPMQPAQILKDFVIFN